MDDEDKMILKLKNSGMDEEQIAMKMGISVENAKASLKAIMEELTQGQSNGHRDLCQQFTVLAHQHQLVGESLLIICQALNNEMTKRELRELIDKDPDKTVQNLKDRCIVLRPFEYQDPVERFKKSVNRN